MRKIQKTFSLEPMTSRMPSVWPAYKDNVLYYFDDASLREREYEYPSNYSMIPLRISLSGIEVNDGAILPTSGWSGVTLSSEQDSCDFYISFERLSKWYYFFKEYYHLLNDYGHCSRTYSSATEYFYYESGERYADQMIYGTEEQTYIDLDKEFEAKGGIVDVDNISISGASDIGFYKWICENVVPSYYISNEYADYWKRKKLYYPDVIKWMAWFNERLMYEEQADFKKAQKDEYGALVESEHWDCKKENIDCCDCEEYFSRGGAREFERMKDWYDTLQINILVNNSAITENLDCFIPTMDDKIELQNSLDDLGQNSIFSKEYELGIDYRTIKTESTESSITINYDDGNSNGGTVVEYKGDTMILKSGEEYPGFCYSKYFMEKLFDEGQWDNYTDVYMKDNPSEFIADGYRYYAFDKDNVMYTGNTSGDVIDAMSSAYTYSITPTDAILIGDTLYPIEKNEYGIYDETNEYIGGKKFFVYREKDTATPYTLINGKKVYAEWYPNPNPAFDNKPCYYFTFFKSDYKTREFSCDTINDKFNITNYKPFGRTSGSTSGDAISYISYYGQIFQIEDDDVSLTIEEVEYPRVIGYAYDDDNVIMYCVNLSADTASTIAVYDYNLKEVPNSEVFDDYIVIGLNYEPTIYNAKELSGRTLSKLTDLESTNVLIDDIGNKIDGKYDPNKEGIYNHQPPEGEELDLLYEVGNTSNIRKINGLTKDKLEDGDKINYFFGNILTEMSFYYKDANNEIVEETRVTLSLDEDGNLIAIMMDEEGEIIVDTAITTSLMAIQTSRDVRESLEEDGMLFDGKDIYCDVVYYIGATLSREIVDDKNGPFKLAGEGYNYGVEYMETVKFVKENREYYLKKENKKQIPTTVNSVSAHSISYPIYVYKLTQEFVEVEGDVYGTYFQSPLAKFRTEINLIDLIDDELVSNFSNYVDMNKYNNIHVTPTFKQEYMLGISSLENIDSDIYIERGINAAFEKHLKLGEVTSLEALEQYSNGYFKIMNN